MLSQARSARYITAVVIVAGLMFAAPHSGYAVMIDTTFEIKVAGEDGMMMSVPAGTLTVKFSGESDTTMTMPADDPTILDITELDHLKLTWEPESGPVPPPPGMFSFESFNPDMEFAMGSAFQYATPAHPTTPDTIIVLDIARGDFDATGARCQDSPMDSPAGNLVSCTPDMPEAMRPMRHFLFVQDATEATETYPIVSAGPIQPPVVIPEPSTWLLLSTGLVGVIGYAFSRRVRSATPRRTPGASA